MSDGRYRKATIHLPAGFQCKTDLQLEVYPPGELVSDVLVQTHAWEPFETRIFLDRMKALTARLSNAGDEKLCVMDVGANLGYYSLIASQCMDAKVLAFEPQEENFRLLENNLQDCEDVLMYQVGLSDAPGSASLDTRPENRGDSRLDFSNVSSNTETIQLTRGDELVDSPVHFLKVDTQGAEYRVLRGLASCLEENQSHLEMIVEFWPMGLERQGSSTIALIDLLESMHLRCYIIEQVTEQLIPTDSVELRSFANTQFQYEQEGFLNLFLSPEPDPESITGLIDFQ